MEILINMYVVFRKALSLCRLYHFHRLGSDGRCKDCERQVVVGKILLTGYHGNIWYLDVPDDDPIEKYATGVVTLDDMRQTRLNKRLDIIRHLHDEMDMSFRQIGETLNVSHVAVMKAYRRAVTLSTPPMLRGNKRSGNIEPEAVI